MLTNAQPVTIGNASYLISGDPGYMHHVGARFEPETFAILEALADQDSQVVDVGANIGMTSIALAQRAPQGRIAAIEPVPQTFEFLRTNIDRAQASNVSLHNFALGAAQGEIVMQGMPDYLAGSFIADKLSINDGQHFREVVQIHRLDDIFSSLGLDRLDVIKADVEGYELDVFEGAADVLHEFKPMVFFEMNHWCLSMFRRITIPEFRERLLTIFPHIYALQDGEYFDLVNDEAAYSVCHGHLTAGKFANVVAGFDKGRLLDCLERLPKPKEEEEKEEEPAGPTLSEVNQTLLTENLRLHDEIALARTQIDAIYASRSWQITKPLRMLSRLISRAV